ncbi:unnamed protein product [Spirodela intermedia]|uniref:Uncharacterized protein n=1 Tax=Spirodela intermedia TaxID=51605 RepID=A0A7I8IVS2_SPIIN|nr:unnamed protein product [Spirodela intermedia]CAA6661958.1 unnamed protein product [Spirodela intermedia]
MELRRAELVGCSARHREGEPSILYTWTNRNADSDSASWPQVSILLGPASSSSTRVASVSKPTFLLLWKGTRKVHQSPETEDCKTRRSSSFPLASPLSSEGRAMDWCFRREVDDLIVPTDGSPSSNSWFQWEFGRGENLVRPDKFFSKTMKKMTQHQALPESCLRDAKDSDDQEAYGDLLFADSCTRTSDPSFQKSEHLGDLPDHPLQNSLERMDFWDSGFIAEIPQMESPSNSSDTAYISTSFRNFSSDMFIDQNNSLNDPCFTGARSTTKGNPLLRLMMLPNMKAMELMFPPFALPHSALVPAELSTSEEMAGLLQEEACLEANVLQELEGVMSQDLLRDALYRLAETSKQHSSLAEDKPYSSVDVNNPRNCAPNSAERETNAIDRIIANMMFNNLVPPHTFSQSREPPSTASPSPRRRHPDYLLYKGTAGGEEAF